MGGEVGVIGGGGRLGRCLIEDEDGVRGKARWDYGVSLAMYDNRSEDEGLSSTEYSVSRTGTSLMGLRTDTIELSIYFTTC